MYYIKALMKIDLRKDNVKMKVDFLLCILLSTHDLSNKSNKKLILEHNVSLSFSLF